MNHFSHKPAFLLHLLLEDVRSHLNTGSVFRSADAFGADHIWLCGITGTPPHRDIHKTALGATETVGWTYAPRAMEVIQKLKAEGFKIYALEQHSGSLMLNEWIPPSGPSLLIIGNEVEGVSPECLSACDAVLEIAQYGSKHSLNVSVAAGVALHHFSRFRF